MTAEQKPGILFCLKHPHETVTATMLKIGASLPEGPGVSLGREEDKMLARQHSIPGLTCELVMRKNG